MKNKKIGIIIMEILLIVALILNAIFGGARDIDSLAEESLKDGQSISLNKTLIYKEPAGYTTQKLKENKIEAFLLKEDKSTNFSIDMISKEYASSDEFLKVQEEFVSKLGEYETKLDEKEEKNGATIHKKGYVIDNGAMVISFFVGAIDFGESNDEYVGVIGSANELMIQDMLKEQDIQELENGTSYDDAVKDFTDIINSIELTEFTLDKYRVYAYESEGIQITMPPNWKKLSGAEKYQFYKEDKENFINVMILPTNSVQESPDMVYETIKANLKQATQGVAIPYEPMYNEELDGYEKTIGDLIVNGIVFEYTEEMEGRKMYTHIALVKSKSNPENAAIVTNDFMITDDIEKYLIEIEEVIKGIDLR